MDVNMSPTPSKVIGKEVCLWTKGPFAISKDLGPKRGPNTLWKEDFKDIRDFMEVCIVKNTMGIAWNKKLAFQRPSEN